MIIDRVSETRVMLAGMQAPRNLGQDYARAMPSAHWRVTR